MSNMGSMDMGGSSMKMGSSSSKMSSSSVSSFSSSMMSSNMSSMLGGGGGLSLSPMRSMDMPGMTIEEMSSPSPATPADTPYTVTAPSSSSPRTHSVGAGADYIAPSVTEPDTSVL